MIALSALTTGAVHSALYPRAEPMAVMQVRDIGAAHRS
jgi:hypothetical protein